MPDRSPTSITHRPLLDGTRGVMMCVVLGYHLDGVTKLPGAWVSMDFFFVLSGYLITTLLVKEQTERGRIGLVEFLRRRVRRLGPALIVVTATVFAAAGVTGGAETWPSLREDGLATLLYVANWHFIWSDQSYFTSFGVSPLRHAWSLAIEEQFYLVWPVAFLLLARATRFRRAAMATVLVALLAGSAALMRALASGDGDLSRAYYGTDTRGQGLIVGALLALLLWHERWDSPRARVVAGRLGTAAFAGLVAMMFAFSDDSRAVYTHGGFLLIAVVSAGLVFGAARADHGPLAWIFGNRASRHFGQLSYSFYLWHWPVIVFLGPPRVTWSPAVLDAVRVLVALGLAEATHRFVEQPIHRRRWEIPRQGVVFAGTFALTLALLVGVTAGGPEVARPPSGGAGSQASGGAADREVLVLGDSMAWLLSGTAPEDLGYRVEGAFQVDCDVFATRIHTGRRIDAVDPTCAGWEGRWRAAIDGELEEVSGDPDAVLVTLGIRHLFDVDDGGTRLVVGSAVWEARYRRAIERAVAVVRSRTDAPILWMEVPCYRWEAAGADGEERDDRRIDVVNRVLADVLAGERGVTVVPYRDRVCDGPDRTESRAELRPDGAHLTVDAAEDYWRSLVPTLDAVVR